MSESDTIPCPKCGHDLFELVVRLKDNRVVRCPGCGATTAVDFEDPSGGVSKSPEEMAEDIIGGILKKFPES